MVAADPRKEVDPPEALPSPHVRVLAHAVPGFELGKLLASLHAA
jgi:hypothetical protein